MKDAWKKSVRYCLITETWIVKDVSVILQWGNIHLQKHQNKDAFLYLVSAL